MSDKSGTPMPNVNVTSRQNRLGAVIAGVLILVSGTYGYHIFDHARTAELASLSSVPRLQVAELKEILDRSRAREPISGVLSVPGPGPNPATSATPAIPPRPYLIDVRPRAAYEEGHIPGALSLPQPELEVSITSVAPPSDSDALIVLYCA